MKKFLWVMLAWVFGIALSVGFASAADCLNVKFDNWDSVCLEISKSGTNSYKISVSKNNLSKNASLMCSILAPNSKIYQLWPCKGSFSYKWSSTQSVTIYASYTDNKNKSHFKRQTAKINFNNGSWGSSSDVISVSSSSSSSSSSSNSDIELSTNRKSPSTSQYVNLTIKTDKNYTGKLYLSAKYRRYSSDSRSSISNASSSYFNDYSSDWSNEYYKMTSSDRGNVTLNNLVKFRKDGYYRIYVRDTDGNESYIQFSVGDVSSSSSSNDELKVSASPSNPDTYEWVKLTIETDDDYTGKINFSKFQYRSSSSSSWSTISSRTSSTYVSDYSSEWSNGYYKMTSSDDGEAVLKNLVKFKKSWYYRIYVEDTYWNESYVQINVDVSSSSSNDELKVSASPSNPDTYEWVKLTIETDDDYTGKINFSKFQYRSSSSSSWSTISSRTSSTYVSDYSSEWSNGYYKMTSSDDGEAVLKNLVKFKKSWYYRIYVEDTYWNESYVQINVDVSSSSSNDELKVSASPSNPDTYEWVKLTIETDDDYTGKINFSKFQYRSSSSSSWSTISSRTSSTYVSDYSSEWSNGYYKMTSSDDGYVTLKNLVKFKKSGYYRIYVEDTDGNESYVQINVDVSSSSSSSSNSDKVKLSTNRKSPSTSQYVNLTIETDSTRYTGKLTFSAKYRSSSSDSWSSISRTSSSYFNDYSNEWDNGYYKMTSSDKGEVTLKNLVKFKKNGYYRIYVEDTSGNESYIQFTVGNVSSSSDDESEVSWFSTTELEKVKTVYKNRSTTISQMSRNYPKLKNDTYWERLSNNFYNDMKDVINNKSPRDFDDYDDFKEAFDDWYKYTLQNI